MAGNVNELRNGAFIKESRDIFSMVTYEHMKTVREYPKGAKLNL